MLQVVRLVARSAGVPATLRASLQHNPAHLPRPFALKHRQQCFWLPTSAQPGGTRQISHSLATSNSAGAPASQSGEAPKAALMIVGNEILSGNVVDTNTPWLAKLLHGRGVDLVRVEVVPDEVADIAATALRLRQRVGSDGFVFSSGGIGPTHDDLTYEALASAFGVRLELHQPTVERMRESYAKRGMELNEARLRMATLPTPSEILFTPGTWVPLVNLQGVYILPGIPKLFTSMITANQDRFSGPSISEATLYSVAGESFIADQLSEVTKAHPQVSISSLPNTDTATEEIWKVRLCLSSRSQDALHKALESLRQALPALKDTRPE